MVECSVIPFLNPYLYSLGLEDDHPSEALTLFESTAYTNFPDRAGSITCVALKLLIARFDLRQLDFLGSHDPFSYPPPPPPRFNLSAFQKSSSSLCETCFVAPVEGLVVR